MSLDVNCLSPLTYQDWMKGWKTWAAKRKRGKLAQFIVGLLEEQSGARWVDITKGKFELTEWHKIAQEWYKQKARSSQTQDAPCMLRKGLPRAFPQLIEVKGESLKDGTQYRSRMFQCSDEVIREVYMEATGQPIANMSSNSSYTNDDDDDEGDFDMNETDDTIDIMYPPYQYQTSQGMIGSHSISTGPSHPMVSQSSSQFPNGQFLLNNVQPPPPSYPAWDSQGQDSNISSPANMHKMHHSPQPAPMSNTMLSEAADSPPQQYPDSPYHQDTPPYKEPPPIVMQDSPQYVPTSSEHISGIHQGMMLMKACPRRSPLQGGGEVAVIFQQQLPPGAKFIQFFNTQTSAPVVMLTREENGSTLSCEIPRHNNPEVVMLQVVCNGHLIAQTEFEYYATPSDDLQQIYHLLQGNLPGFFPNFGAYGGVAGGSGQIGGGNHGLGGSQYMGGGYQYATSPIQVAYLLLLGSCKSGIREFVYALIDLPQGENLLSIRMPNGQLPEELASENNHCELAAEIKYLRELNEGLYERLGITLPSVISRGNKKDIEKDTEKKEIQRKELEKKKKELVKGDKSPKSIVDGLMKGLKKVIDSTVSISHQMTKKEDGPEVNARGGKKVEVKKTVKSEPSHDVEELSNQLDRMALGKDELSRQLKVALREKTILEERLTATQKELDEAHDEVGTRTAMQQQLMDRFKRTGSPSITRRAMLTRDYSILSDHGICVSFDEEVSKRRTSSLISGSNYSLLSDQTEKTVTVAVPPECNIADSLIYDTYHLITDDYPPGPEQDVLLRYGDRIVEINGKTVKGLSSTDIDELLRRDGCQVKVVMKTKS